uniref:Cytochrome c oxidase subunit 3 n=1 Tax=Sphaeropleales sp. YC001 TaxID=1715688 RepID=A0A0N9HIV7_9CHLO|nr:cytochrome oxidase subunit 3 [Sphaeropleales sp. YC001]
MNNKVVRSFAASAGPAQHARPAQHHAVPTHGYHLVDFSPWPILTRFRLLWLLSRGVLVFHQYRGAPTVALLGFCFLLFTATSWWRDITREGVSGYHTSLVKAGLKAGMMLFILSERTLFAGFVWRFLHRALMPTVQIGMSWPPVGIVPVDRMHLPLANTLLLLRSYFSCNMALYAMRRREHSLVKTYLAITIGLGALFVYGQYLEYTGAAFTISDGVFGSAFYLLTGLHGRHVIVGRRYLRVCYFLIYSSSPKHHVSLALRRVYWHFVDIVWVVVLSLAYVWGGAVPAPELRRCNDSLCAMATMLSDSKQFLFSHPQA